MPVDLSDDPTRMQMSLRPAIRALPADEVHVYVTNLDELSAESTGLAALLSQEERVRAARFHFTQHRERFIARRAVLRWLLGSYLGSVPREVHLVSGRHGKPALATSTSGPRLGFNLSHSDEIAMHAFAWNRQVGVDVERVREDLDHRDLAASFFSTGEQEALSHISKGDLPKCFFACWTRKEAVVKACGAGLSMSLRTFDVSVLPDAEPCLAWATSDLTGNWGLMSMTPRPGFIGALAVEGAPWTVHITQTGQPLTMWRD